LTATGTVTADARSVAAPTRRHGNLLANVENYLRVPLLVPLALAAMLVVKNTALFRVTITENGDAAANSLLVRDAEAFHLLVGNYSRFGFYHPGPAFMDVQAAGELLFFRLLHVVPSPYNGQALAVLLLNAAMAGSAAVVLWTWHRSTAALVLTLGIMVAFYAGHPQAVASTWPPFMYVSPFLLFLVAAASVAAGRTRHLVALAVAGGFLVHGHIAFTLFVACIGACSLVAHRLTPHTSGDAQRKHWRAFGVIVALFVAPILLHTALDWPGELHKYISYGGAVTRVPRTFMDVVAFGATFWTTDNEWGLLLPVFLVTMALGAAALATAQLRRALLTLLVAAGAAQLLFFVYADRGVDDLQYHYVGYFMWNIPLLCLLCAAIGLAVRVEAEAGRKAAAGAITLGLTSLLIGYHGPGLAVTSGYAGDPQLATAASLIAASYPGRGEVVLGLHGGAPWVDVTGVLLLLERKGLPTCVTGAEGPQITAITPQRTCDTADLSAVATRADFVNSSDPVPAAMQLSNSRLVLNAHPIIGPSLSPTATAPVSH
jgi:hypothetical protein